jgi:hypothetical protein
MALRGSTFHQINKTMKRLSLAFSIVCALIVAGVVIYGRGRQQESDPDFDAKVARPAYVKAHPKVLIDEAHNNFHTAGGRYKPFATLLSNDGYQIISNKEKFQPSMLKGHDVLVIANALGAAFIFATGADKPAFTEAECDAVRDWVRDGGSLLLIADHAPVGGANEILSKRFGVEMSKLHTLDKAHADLKNGGNPGWIIYSRENGLLGDHPITQGRDATEKVNSVTTFTGQALKGPQGSAAFLRLADTVVDYDMKAEKEVPTTGDSQAVALRFGKEKLVVLGEAAMMTAQVAGPNKLKFGMNREGNDDKQLALNIMHWLSGLLDR